MTVSHARLSSPPSLLTGEPVRWGSLCRRFLWPAAVSIGLCTIGGNSQADETGLSPHVTKLKGQEELLYVWTAGQEGLGDGEDKLVTVDVNPQSSGFGKILHVLTVKGHNEAQQGDFTADRQYLWLGGLATSRIFIVDIHTDPGKPQLSKTLNEFTEISGGVLGPNAFYALPGSMLVSGLSNARDHSGRTALVEYQDTGRFVATYWLPTELHLQGIIKTGRHADGFGYDIRGVPGRNIILTSSFTGADNYRMDFDRLMQDRTARQRFGNTVTLWDLETHKPKKIFDVPGAPLALRCAWQLDHHYCFTATAMTNKIWLVYEDNRKDWQVKEVADINTAEKNPLLPVALSISAEDDYLWVNTHRDGSTRLYNIRDPFKPKLIYQAVIGKQLGQVAQSWDGKRLYFSSSFLSDWDKKGSDNEQFVKAFQWNGKQLNALFSIDFIKEKLGRPKSLRFSAYRLYKHPEPVPLMVPPALEEETEGEPDTGHWRAMVRKRR